MKKKMQYRQVGEIRASTDEGIVEAYLTAWGTVDSYKTSFQRGCFKRTFADDKIRLIFNHDVLAGKVIESREDDYGPFVKVQFNLDTRAGKEAFAHVKAGDIECFSFGFGDVKDTQIGGIRTFTDLTCYECGPVIFEANSAAVVTDARAEDFNETVTQNELSNRGWKLFYALEQTIDDIYWNESQPSQVIAKTDVAISSFHGAYMEWLQEYYNQFDRDDSTKFLTRTGNLIQEAIKNTENIEEITRETSLKDSELDRLKTGKLLKIESRAKLDDLPENIRKAHQVERRNTVERLCAEIRDAGLTDAEKQRFGALLGLTYPSSENDDISSFFDDLRQSLK